MNLYSFPLCKDLSPDEGGDEAGAGEMGDALLLLLLLLLFSWYVEEERCRRRLL